jgi:hypothetical protein
MTNLDSIKISDYSSKSILVTGENTFNFKDEFKSMGGKYNKNLKNECKGWIFQKKKKQEVINFLENANVSYSIVQNLPEPDHKNLQINIVDRNGDEYTPLGKRKFDWFFDEEDKIDKVYDSLHDLIELMKSDTSAKDVSKLCQTIDKFLETESRLCNEEDENLEKFTEMIADYKRNVWYMSMKMNFLLVMFAAFVYRLM